MPHRLINIDLVMLTLNLTSVTTLGMAWFSDNLNSIGGFVVMLSIAYLNISKARKINNERRSKG